MIKRPDLFNVQTRKKQLKKLPKAEIGPSQFSLLKTSNINTAHESKMF